MASRWENTPRKFISIFCGTLKPDRRSARVFTSRNGDVHPAIPLHTRFGRQTQTFGVHVPQATTRLISTQCPVKASCKPCKYAQLPFPLPSYTSLPLQSTAPALLLYPRYCAAYSALSMMSRPRNRLRAHSESVSNNGVAPSSSRTPAPHGLRYLDDSAQKYPHTSTFK